MTYKHRGSKAIYTQRAECVSSGCSRSVIYVCCLGSLVCSPERPSNLVSCFGASWCVLRAALCFGSAKMSWSPVDPRAEYHRLEAENQARLQATRWTKDPKGYMTVLKVFSYTWLCTLPSTHVTRSSEAVLVKYNYNYFFPAPQ